MVPTTYYTLQISIPPKPDDRCKKHHKRDDKQYIGRLMTVHPDDIGSRTSQNPDCKQSNQPDRFMARRWMLPHSFVKEIHGGIEIMSSHLSRIVLVIFVSIVSPNIRRT